MKKIKSLLILGVLLIVGLLSQSQSITYRFNNYHVVPASGPDTLIFDVEAKSNVATTYPVTFTIKINYSVTAFGLSALPVVVQPLELAQPSGYNFNTLAVVIGSSRFGSTFKANPLASPHGGGYQTAYLSNLTTEYKGLVRYKMLITGTGNLGVAFHMTGSSNMTTGQNFILTSGGTASTPYNPVSAANNLLNLPPDPSNLNLMLTEIGDPSNSTTNFVELYNAGTTSIDFATYPWYLNFNESNSIQLTGTLAAGSKYTVAYDNVDFTPNLVSTNVGTGGATNYSLTMYSNYVDGTTRDVYDGSASGFNYTGKHAVRLYNVTSPNPVQTAAEWAITPAENIDMTPGSHLTTLTWSGSTSEWRSKTNWTGSFIPDAGHNVSIPNSGGTIPVVSAGDNATCYGLAIGGSGIGLIIESDEFAGDGSLINYGPTSGTASVKRFLKADR